MEILVTGGTGKAGRRMVEALAGAGLDVRVGSRHPGAPSEHLTPVDFDWYDQSTWASALGHAEGLVVKGLDLDQYAAESVRMLLESAPHVRHVVFLSNMGVEYTPDDHPRRAIELVVQNSGKEWTILRANWFMQNFDEDDAVFAEAIRTRGEVHAPAGDAKVSFVDTRDLAAATAAVFATAGHDGRAYAISGPEAISFAEVAAAIGATCGASVRHIDGTPEEHREYMRGPDRPAAYVNHINHLFIPTKAGACAAVSGDVELLTGRPPRTFGSYVEETWSASESGLPQPVAHHEKLYSTYQ
ncbi:NAD(P)H-binding protein [Nocardia sp. BSTN01]|uniref:NmrA family NAD(P)-binding protein n=1 Tax=Nocardia sp. BSTN01 TaxID=2783665 RepID=UPI00189004CF|nr:NAD(P)H-binding protein [Nocardia sp. BSTN01]MBF5000401.1 NAD(P)H-binding protein [Nocardia sp. BSTN01]